MSNNMNIGGLYPFITFWSCLTKRYFIFRRGEIFKMRKMRTNKTRLFTLVTVLLLICALFAGCGNTADTNSQGEKIYKIGVLQISDHPSLDNCREGFIEGLANAGYVDGENLEIEFASAQDDMAKNTQIAQTFANSNTDLVCGIATPSAQALYAACIDKQIPVIFNAVSDPVAASLAKSETEAFPGISGVSDKLPVEAQLKLIREIMPQAKKIGILYSTGEANSVSTLSVYKSLAPSYGFEIVESGVSKKADIPQAADVLLSKVDCISNMTDNTVVSAMAVILDKSNALKIPVFGSEEEQVTNGCIAAAGLDYYGLGIQAGEMAAKVLSGTDISTIPYETLTESSITINTSVADSLGITIPDSIKATAQEK